MAMPDQGRRRVVGVAALGVVVLVAVGLAVPVARGLLEDEPVAPVAPVLTGGGPWERLPRPPANDIFQGPELGSAVWTGKELLLLADSAFTPPPSMGPPDALAYDPAADTWTPVPGLAGGAIAPEAASAWTGSELVVWSTTADKSGRSVANTASAYDPGAGRWRALPPAPITPRRLAALVWAGDRLLVWGGIRNLPGDRLAYPDDGAAYDPRRDRWQRLARAPVPGRASPLTAWTGDRAVFIGGMNVGDRLRMDRGNIPAVTEQGAAYHPR